MCYTMKDIVSPETNYCIIVYHKDTPNNVAYLGFDYNQDEYIQVPFFEHATLFSTIKSAKSIIKDCLKLFEEGYIFEIVEVNCTFKRIAPFNSLVNSLDEKENAVYTKPTFVN